MKNITLRRIILIGAGIIVVAACLTLALPQLWYPLWFDQGAFAACADALRQGGVMYRDCWEVRGPLAVVAYLIPMLISPSPLAIHVFDLAWQALTAVMIVIFGRKLFGSRAGIVAGVLYWLLYASINYWAAGQAEGFANLFFVVGLYAAWRGTHGNWRWLVLSGFCAGITFWFKYPFALIGVVPFGLIVMQRVRHTATVPFARSLVLFIDGAVVALLAGLLYFALNGALSDLAAQITYDVATFNNVALSYRLEWLRTIFWVEIVAFVNIGNTPTAGFKDTVEQVFLLGRGFPFVFLTMLFALAAGLGMKRLRPVTLYAFAYLAVTMAINLWQGHFYRYHYVIVLPAMALLAGAALEHARQINTDRPWVKRALRAIPIVTIALAVIGLASSMVPWARDALYNVIVMGKTPEAITLESKLASYALLAKSLREQTEPGERIVVFSDVPAIYPLAQRANGTRFPYLRWAMESGSTEVRADYIRVFVNDMERNQPRFFVLTQPDFPWTGVDFIALWKSIPAIHDFVEQHYHYVGENGPFLLFARNSE
ncbi:MAG TPA: glycosyltransferase family 39 protein [Anaerolineae bacterium]